jgi:hypothetical protein
MTSGMAQRTLKNLDYLEGAQKDGADVHLVTQVVNSLLSLLVFPVEKEKIFFHSFCGKSLPSCIDPSPADIARVCATITRIVPGVSLHVRMFGECPNVAKFFKRIRNAISHKNVDFDSDSLSLYDVWITLKDRKDEKAPFDWEIAMTAADLRTIAVYLGHEIIGRNL